MRYKIADLAVDMESFGRTKGQAAAYAAPVLGPADITIDVNTREILEKNPALETLDTAYYMATGAYFARALLDFSGIQLHASAIALDSKAYLFSAYSGTGKSTHTKKWCRLFGAHYINDDKPALRFVDGQWMAYGTPWSGKHDLSCPQGYPVGGIAFLVRGEENAIEPLTPAQALPLIMAQTYRYLNGDEMAQKLALLDRCLRAVPIWKLTCQNNDEAALLSHAVMTK